MFKAGILIMSDKGSRGEREDLSSAEIRRMLDGFCRFEYYEIIPDEREMIVERLRYACDELKLDILLTSGGTGFSPRDVTPEATLAVVERPAPGLSEAIRAYGMQQTPRAMLSRAAAGIRGKTLIINLPGSVKAVREALEAVLPSLEHGLEILTGRTGECGQP
ncbi:MAG: MogA/MoaB family molybdenum cofactor biosynthesis protein [Syntrophomonadaceae bacterium]|nr:MogA/MoaB family molybdenum cofactor biosynthesis protein [Syntrophomonadaceae bacterium]